MAWGPNGEGDPRFWGLGEQLPPSQGSRGLICTQLCVPALPRLLPASFQYKLPPPSTFPRQAPPHLHTDHASNATNPAPWFTYRPRPPALHTAPPPSPSPSPHGFASSNAPPGSHLHTGHTPSPLVLPSPSFAYGGPAPPLRPAHLGALRGAVGADELHEVLERILPVVVADGGVGEVRPRLGQEGARREVQRRGCGPRAACRDPQCSGAPPSPPNRAHP